MAPLHAGIKRRHFLQILGAAVVAVALPTPPVATPAKIGDSISIRFVQQFEPSTTRHVNRLDIIYGFRTLQPSPGVRISA